MISLKSLILCLIIITATACNAVKTKTTGGNIGDLSKEVINDIHTLLVLGTVSATGNCSSANDTSQVQYWLYTRNNPNDSIIINSYNQIDANKPVIFLIHGWGGNADVDYIHVIKEAYLKRYDCNVISINYQTYAATNYQTSYCHIPAIGRNIAKFICNMTSILEINLSDLHVVGHSLGGQTAGFVGKNTKKMCGTLGRITALDPAGPLYQGIDKEDRLDKTDAAFVQVIHTDQGKFGYAGDCGDVDFYPNCGFHQPGCVKPILNETSTIEDVKTLPLRLVDCSHKRSCYLFAESINNNSFYSSSCTLCRTPTCTKQIIGATYAYMGENCRSKPKDRHYTFETNSKSPYGKGPKGLLN